MTRDLTEKSYGGYLILCSILNQFIFLCGTLILLFASQSVFANSPNEILAHHKEVVNQGSGLLLEIESLSHAPIVRDTLADEIERWLTSDPELLEKTAGAFEEVPRLSAVGAIDKPLPVSCTTARMRYTGALIEWQLMRKLLHSVRNELQRSPFCACRYQKAAEQLRASFGRFSQWYPDSWDVDDHLVTYTWDVSEVLVQQAKENIPGFNLERLDNLRITERAIWIGLTRFDAPAVPPGLTLRAVDGDAPAGAGIVLEQAASVTDLCISRSDHAIFGEIQAAVSYKLANGTDEIFSTEVSSLPIVLLGTFGK